MSSVDLVNVAPSQTGRFPNPGPLALVRGGVRLIDAPGADLFDVVDDGELVTVRGASLFRNGTRLVAGQILGADELAERLAEQRGRVTEALEAFAENTMRYLRDAIARDPGYARAYAALSDLHAIFVVYGYGQPHAEFAAAKAAARRACVLDGALAEARNVKDVA